MKIDASVALMIRVLFGVALVLQTAWMAMAVRVLVGAWPPSPQLVLYSAGFSSCVSAQWLISALFLTARRRHVGAVAQVVGLTGAAGSVVGSGLSLLTAAVGVPVAIVSAGFALFASRAKGRHD